MSQSNLKIPISPVHEGGTGDPAGSLTRDGEGLAGITLPWLRPIRQNEHQAVSAAVAADSDGIVRPSHLIEQNGEIIGAISIGTVMLLDVWTHRRKMKARNSLTLLNLIENLAAEKGAKVVCLPCTSNSPYRPYMTKFGYTYNGESGMHYKQL